MPAPLVTPSSRNDARHCAGNRMEVSTPDQRQTAPGITSDELKTTDSTAAKTGRTVTIVYSFKVQTASQLSKICQLMRDFFLLGTVRCMGALHRSQQPHCPQSGDLRAVPVFAFPFPFLF
jgi:hypothetical protein